MQLECNVWYLCTIIPEGYVIGLIEKADDSRVHFTHKYLVFNEATKSGHKFSVSMSLSHKRVSKWVRLSTNQATCIINNLTLDGY